LKSSFWLAVAAYLVPTFPLGYVWHLVSFGEQYHRLEMYRKHRMASVPDFMLLETAFTALQFAVVAPLIALAWRAPASHAQRT
jgi:hypothetical protein